MGPSDPQPNWHIGMRGTQHRAVMWRVWKEGGTGFLYWGTNCYEKAMIPSAEVYCGACKMFLNIYQLLIVLFYTVIYLSPVARLAVYTGSRDLVFVLKDVKTTEKY